MNTHADKSSENKSQALANSLPKLKSNNKSAFQFGNNRPETVAQRKLQEAFNTNARVKQLKAYQEMANNSSQVKQATQLQAMANNCSAPHQNPIQKKENNTGLSDNLKSEIENPSGYSKDDVKVHYNSDTPAQLLAHAYAQKTDAKIQREIKGITQQIPLKEKETITAKSAISVIQPMKNTSVAQLYSDEGDGKLSENQQMLLQDSYNLFVSPEKFDEANKIDNQIAFNPGKNSAVFKDLKEVIPFVKPGSELDKAMEQFNEPKENGDVKENALRKVPDLKYLISHFKEIITDFLEDGTALPDHIKTESDKIDLNDKEKRKELVNSLAEAAHHVIKEKEIPAIEKRVDEYLETQLNLKTRPLMPSDCRAMANYVAGFDAGSDGLDVTDQPALAGDVYEYTSEHPKTEWPFHYATVIMTDGGDHVTMENAAAKASDKFSKMQYDHSWFFEMYGTKKGQTFDDKYDPMLNPK